VPFETDCVCSVENFRALIVSKPFIDAHTAYWKRLLYIMDRGVEDETKRLPTMDFWFLRASYTITVDKKGLFLVEIPRYQCRDVFDAITDPRVKAAAQLCLSNGFMAAEIWSLGKALVLRRPHMYRRVVRMRKAVAEYFESFTAYAVSERNELNQLLDEWEECVLGMHRLLPVTADAAKLAELRYWIAYGLAQIEGAGGQEARLRRIERRRNRRVPDENNNS